LAVAIYCGHCCGHFIGFGGTMGSLPFLCIANYMAEREKIDPAPMGCADVDARTITVMMGVLTTLISLSRNAE
jgi:hypothetical protein